MRAWTADDPGLGDVGALHVAASTVSRHIEHAADMSVLLQSSGAGMASAWSGDGHDAWEAALSQRAAGWKRLHGFAEAAYDALHRYADELESIKQRAGRATGRLKDAEALLGTATGLETVLPGLFPGSSPMPVEHQAIRDHALRELARLADERRTVETRFVADIRRAEEGASLGTRAGGVAAPSPAILAALNGPGLLSELSLLTSAQLVDLLRADPSLAERLHQVDPAVVATWWAGLDGPAPAVGSRRQPSAVQQAFIEGMPGVIGNLDGVGFWARDRANNLTLAREIARLEATPGADADTLAALVAVRSSLGRGMNGTPPRELIALSLTGKPKAAISVGDLDSAAHVSYIVPGMGTTVAGNIGAYTTAAWDLEVTEAKVVRGLQPDCANVAWLDYDSPGATDISGVIGDYLARDGGARLKGSLDGLRAVRSTVGRPADVTVLGHSYGSNVVAFAAQDTPVDHVVFLGSAGITRSVPSASALEVPPGEVFATQGHHDGWAPIGQQLSGRQDPTAASFGAHPFDSEEGVDDQGNDLAGVDHHGPVGSRSPDGKHSYLDPGTTAQYNTARIAMGQGSGLEVADTPFDRLLLQGIDRLHDAARLWAP